MSDSDKASFPDFTDFGKLVPGFDFLQNLTRQATGATGSTPGLPKLPQLGSWVAPTINVEELDKRISELKSVQFWLDQNATALKATIQALEVQKMTLATLKGMNLNMTEMANAFTVKMQDSMGLGGHARPAAKSPATSPDKGHHFAGLEVPETSYAKREAAAEDRQPAADTAAQAASAETSVPGLIDPLQWWGALTQQFQTIANTAMKEVTARNPLEAGQSLAQDALKTATEIADSATKTMTQSANSARDLMTGALRSGDGWPVPGTTRKRTAAGSAAGKPAAKKTSQTAAKTTRKAAPAKSASSARSNRASASGKDGAVNRKAGGRSR